MPCKRESSLKQMLSTLSSKDFRTYYISPYFAFLHYTIKPITFQLKMKIFRHAVCERAPDSLGSNANLLVCLANDKSNRRYPATKSTQTARVGCFLLAGVARFELTNKGVKVRVAPAWRYPCIKFWKRIL